jgi:G protein-coupled glucose receptor regulating Gpa2
MESDVTPSGLAISDLIMAVNFLSSTALNLSGNFIGSPKTRPFCLYNGFMTQFFVIQTDYWIFTIAICTYFMVGGHQKASKWVQSHRAIIFALPPGVSLIWALIGLGLKAYDNIGACKLQLWLIIGGITEARKGCWFPSDRTRLLVNFIPRWIIIIGCLSVYLHLFITIFRTQRQSASNANDETWLSAVVDENEKQAASKTRTSSHTNSWNSGNLPEASASRSQSSPTLNRRSMASSQYSLAPALKKVCVHIFVELRFLLTSVTDCIPDDDISTYLHVNLVITNCSSYLSKYHS